MRTLPAGREWVKFDTNTHTYRTGDGTAVAAEIVDSAQCLADIFYIAEIRERQRALAAAGTKETK